MKPADDPSMSVRITLRNRFVLFVRSSRMRTDGSESALDAVSIPDSEAWQ